MQTKAIGIISWLPDDNTREVRRKRLEMLIKRLDELFNLPIIIVAQDWEDNEVEISKNVLLLTYHKLGITKARMQLREEFLKLNYDVLIMLDDDAEIVGTKEHVDEYLRQIDDNPGKFGIFKGTLLKLFAIPREILNEVEYEDVEAERGEGFEDMIFVEKCKKMFPNNYFFFTRYGLNDRSDSGNDQYSTWWKHQYAKKDMGDRSREIIKKL